MRFVLGELAERTGVQPHPRVFTGTSAGALNAAFLAASAGDARSAGRQLAEYWLDLTADRVFRFGSRDLLRSGELLFGRRWGGFEVMGGPRRAAAPHPPVAGLFDTRPLHKEMETAIPWERIDRNLGDGTIRGVALCATEVCTGRAVVFSQTAEGVTVPPPSDASRSLRPVRLAVEHAMASAAIPFVFPSVQVDGICFVDGGLFLNTPLVPAIRLGADRLLVVSLSQPPKKRHAAARASCLQNPFPGGAFLVGRLFGSMTDRQLDYELERLGMINRMLDSGFQLHGQPFVDEFDEAAIAFRNASYRKIEAVHIRPSRNLNELAVQTLTSSPGSLRIGGSAGRALRRLLLSGPLLESELTSFLAFCPPFARALIDLGHEDARARQDELAELFGG